MKNVNSSLKIVILGMMGRCPYGGQTWLYLNWMRALKLLGHEVYYVEDDTVWPFDPVKNSISDDCSYAVRHIDNSLKRIGENGIWAYRLADRDGACWGMSSSQLDELYKSCDVLLNICGATELREVHMKAPFRVYLETDPVGAELRLAIGDEQIRTAFDSHDLIVTYGENYGADDCLVPLNGLDQKYRKTRQPIDLDFWPMTYDPTSKYFTTIGNYRQKGGDVDYNGDTYRWSKHHEWERFIGLPSKTKQMFNLFIKVDDQDDRRRLEECGWIIESPLMMSLDVFGEYRDFIGRSRGEFTVAKDQNVRMRSGWFSERDVCYLAMGKPVVVQDTGFGSIIPCGEGLFVFSDMGDILSAIDSINSNYEVHCRKAREIAQEFFEARRVGEVFMKSIGLS